MWMLKTRYINKIKIITFRRFIVSYNTRISEIKPEGNQD